MFLKGVWIGTLYNIQGITSSGEKAMLWHQRLGNIKEKGFRLLHGKGMVEGMPNFSLDFDLC